MFSLGRVYALERDLAIARDRVETLDLALVREREQSAYWREKCEALIDQLLARASARPVMETKVHPAVDAMLNELPQVMTSLAMREIPGEPQD